MLGGLIASIADSFKRAIAPFSFSPGFSLGNYATLNTGNHFNGFLLRAIPNHIASQTSRILPNMFACDDALLDLRCIAPHARHRSAKLRMLHTRHPRQTDL